MFDKVSINRLIGYRTNVDERITTTLMSMSPEC